MYWLCNSLKLLSVFNIFLMIPVIVDIAIQWYFISIVVFSNNYFSEGFHNHTSKYFLFFVANLLSLFTMLIQRRKNKKKCKTLIRLNLMQKFNAIKSGKELLLTLTLTQLHPPFNPLSDKVTSSGCDIHRQECPRNLCNVYCLCLK